MTSQQMYFLSLLMKYATDHQCIYFVEKESSYMFDLQSYFGEDYPKETVRTGCYVYEAGLSGNIFDHFLDTATYGKHGSGNALYYFDLENLIEVK